MYLTDRDVPLTDEDTPTLLGAAYSSPAPTLSIAARDVDLYITVPGETTVIAGPFPIDATLGSIVNLLVVDTVDPATAEIIDITAP